MSELKAIKIELNNHGKPIASIQGTTSYYGISPNDTFYSQEEVDKVIAELEEKLLLKTEFAIQCQMAAHTLQRKLRYNKYKRGLGIAAVCFEKSYSTTLVKNDKESGYRLNFYDWWGKRWLELAEEPTWAKFLQLIHKEAK